MRCTKRLALIYVFLERSHPGYTFAVEEARPMGKRLYELKAKRKYKENYYGLMTLLPSTPAKTSLATYEGLALDLVEGIESSLELTRKSHDRMVSR